MTKKVLVVDDERKIVDIVKAYLERDGFSVTTAYNGRSALEEVRRNSPDIIILDLMLPEISGWDVCRSLRKESDVPVIMLTARDEATEKIVGLEIGADDYVTKPFDPKELVARVKAVLRRSENKVLHDKVVRVANLEINIEKRRVVAKSGDIIELTPFEFDLLKIMAEHPGRVYSRMQLLDKVQREAYEAYERTVDTHIKNLRRKIEPNPEKPSYIITVYGVGYKIEGD
jgi:DNA-binding response OmpR family regulator